VTCEDAEALIYDFFECITNGLVYTEPLLKFWYGLLYWAACFLKDHPSTEELVPFLLTVNKKKNAEQINQELETMQAGIDSGKQHRSLILSIVAAN